MAVYFCISNITYNYKYLYSSKFFLPHKNVPLDAITYLFSNVYIFTLFVCSFYFSPVWSGYNSPYYTQNVFSVLSDLFNQRMFKIYPPTKLKLNLLMECSIQSLHLKSNTPFYFLFRLPFWSANQISAFIIVEALFTGKNPIILKGHLNRK